MFENDVQMFVMCSEIFNEGHSHEAAAKSSISYSLTALMAKSLVSHMRVGGEALVLRLLMDS